MTRLLTIFLICLASLALTLPPKRTKTVVLAWDLSQSPLSSVDHYSVYWGPAPHFYTNAQNFPSPPGSITNLKFNTAYYFTSTATGTNKLESAFSNEASVIPPPPLTNKVFTLELSLDLNFTTLIPLQTWTNPIWGTNKCGFLRIKVRNQ